jgi:hypothetical protein
MIAIMIHIGENLRRFLTSEDGLPYVQDPARTPTAGSPGPASRTVVVHLSFNASGRLESVEFDSGGESPAGARADGLACGITELHRSHVQPTAATYRNRRTPPAH